MMSWCRYSRAGEQPIDAVIATLPVLFGVRGAAAPAEAEPDLDSDIVWEWEEDRGFMHAFHGARYEDDSDGDDGDRDGWRMYDVAAMGQLDAEWAKVSDGYGWS